MTTTRGSADYAGLLPVKQSDEPPLIRPTTIENDQSPNRQPPLGKRALGALAPFVRTFCIVVAATFAWQSYGDAARQMIANSYPEFGWLAPRHAATLQKAPDTMALAGSAAPRRDQRQLDAMLGDLHAMRLSLDQIAAGQELITRSIDEIANRITGGQERMTRSTDQTAMGIAHEPRTRSTNETAATIAAGQDQITRNADQTAASVDQAPSKATSIPAESRTDGAWLQPTARLNIKPTEAMPSQTSSEKDKQSSAASRHDASCLPSASAVVQNHPGGWPTWTLRAPGHEGTMCWYAAARPRGSDHRPRVSDPRSEKTPGKEIVGTTESGLSEPPAWYEWQLMGR
jgi:hypothetical protein